jgi:DNA-binding transcriptional LysR family regulator
MAEQIRTGPEQAHPDRADPGQADPDWEDVRVFVALARHGSLSAAARALSVNHATVARRLASLERALGEKLAERRADGYALTAAGQRALAAGDAMEAAAALLGGPADHGPRGLVRISATPGLTHAFLVARLAGLTGQHPGIDIELAGDVRAVSLERHEADIALRLGRPANGDLLAKRVCALGYGLYGSPERCARIERGEAPVFVGFDEAHAHLPESVWLAQNFPRARIAFRADDHTAQAAAARAGAGIALLPHVIGREGDGLRRCAIGAAPPARDLWLVTRRPERKHPAVRVVADFLFEAIARESALLAAD